MQNNVPTRPVSIIGFGATGEATVDETVPVRPITPIGNADWWNRINNLQTTTAAVASAATGNTGTVESVGLSAPSEFIVAGSPVTVTGTFALTKATQTPNLIWASPASGPAAVPVFRSLVTADFPLSGVTANTYKFPNVTVDATGRVTAASNNPPTGVVGVTVDGGIATPGTGIAGYVVIPYACTITSWDIMSVQTGNVQFDIRTASSVSGIGSPTSIVASAPPLMSAAQSASSSTLTGWNTTVAAGTLVAFYVTSILSLVRVTLQLNLQKT